VIAPLVVVTGTGTGIGKTQLSGALLLAWSRRLHDAGIAAPAVAGLKPVETGVRRGGGEGDGGTLERLSTFHVKRFPAPYLLARAVSPHLAARDEGVTVELLILERYVMAVREAAADGVVVELAGGLFSPLAPGLCNADVARALAGDRVLLVAPDRLGVLHEVAATTCAARTVGVMLSAIVLVTPEAPDASTGTNAGELSHVTDLPVLAVLPRGSIHELATRGDLIALLP
jgi:dethiobiotin synthetase